MKKIYFILAVLLASLTNGNATNIWDGSRATGFASGTGTQADPYLISTCAQLAYLADQVNAATGALTYAGVYFKLTDDLDLNNQPWTPIGGNGATTKKFLGSFDGNNHIIKNMSMPSIINSQSNVGLFGYIYENTATDPTVIKNLGLVDFTMTCVGEMRSAGGLVGVQDAAAANSTKISISNCFAIGTININGVVSAGTYNTNRIGGLCGKFRGQISNCYARVIVNTTLATTGVTANVVLTQVNAFAGSQGDGTITNSYSAGRVTVSNGSNPTYTLTNNSKSFAAQGTISNCFTSEGATAGVPSGVTAKTDAELKDPTIPATLGTNWLPDGSTPINSGFPILAWQSNAPSATAATNVTTTGYTANWAAVTGATGYYLDIATDPAFTNKTVSNQPVAGTTYAITGLTENTLNYYRIRYSKDGGTTFSENSNAVTIATTPAVPTNAAPTGVTATELNINWTESPLGTASVTYSIDRADDEAFTVNLINRTVTDVLTRNYYNLTANMSFYFRVKATNVSGASNWSTTQKITTLPLAPTSAAATNVTNNGFTANWTAATQGTAAFTYSLKYVVSGQTDTVTVNNIASTNLSQAVSGLTPATTYVYAVKAVNEGGSGAYSAEQTITTQVATGVSDATASSIQVITKNGGILVVNAAQYGVYTVTGSKVAEVSKNTDLTIVKLKPGVYVIKSGNTKEKVVVK